MIEDNCFFSFVDKFVIQDVEHLKERCFIGNLVDDVIFKVALYVWSGLTPDTQCDVLKMIAHL
jgi:hypothetical protein